MNDAAHLTTPRGEADLVDVARMLSLAFAGPREGTRQFIDNAQPENIRILRLTNDPSARPQACFVRVPMGQYFGGKRVPMTGIAGVAVPPESRGGGLALTLMREALREIAAEGTPLSTLYASTQTLYRQVGYEQAGHRFQYRIPIERIAVRDRSMFVRPLTDDDQPAVEACCAAFARAFDGMLDRGPYLWRRVRRNRDDTYDGFGVFGDDGQFEGYLFMAQRRNVETGRHDLALSDLAYATPRAGRRLLGLLADFATVGDDVIFHGGPIHPLFTHMPQQRFTVQKRDYWMLRIVNLPAAIAARGFSASSRAAIHVHVVDDLLPENAGPWTIAIEGGRGQATRGGSGSPLHMNIRALAAIYAGLYSPTQARFAGLLEGDERTIAAADALFQPSCPWMTDMF